MKLLEDTGVERVKMSRQNRAKQFAPFEALKGLRDALRMKEYEAERVQKGDLQEEKILEISKFLLDYDKKIPIKIKYFEDGHEKVVFGVAKVLYEEQCIKIDGKTVMFSDILDAGFDL